MYLTPGLLMTWLSLAHWGQVTPICVGKLAIIGSDNGLSPGRRQAIIWTNAGIFLIGPLWTQFGEILIGIQTISFKNVVCKMTVISYLPQCVNWSAVHGIVSYWASSKQHPNILKIDI